eukprot:6211923-Pleurochrysis_carterae.AAC.3
MQRWSSSARMSARTFCQWLTGFESVRIRGSLRGCGRVMLRGSDRGGRVSQLYDGPPRVG